MDIELYRYAAKACNNVYENHVDVGYTQYRHYFDTINERRWQVLAIAGTNELGDMRSNLNLCSRNGIKLGSYKSAQEIHEKIKHVRARFSYLPLLLTGHSLGGLDALAYMREYNAEKCVVFAPARGFRYWTKRTLKNTTMFIDPDDIVTDLLGFISFGHPKCKVIEAKRDSYLYSIDDHKMRHWIDFTNNMPTYHGDN